MGHRTLSKVCRSLQYWLAHHDNLRTAMRARLWRPRTVPPSLTSLDSRLLSIVTFGVLTSCPSVRAAIVPTFAFVTAGLRDQYRDMSTLTSPSQAYMLQPASRHGSIRAVLLSLLTLSTTSLSPSPHRLSPAPSPTPSPVALDPSTLKGRTTRAGLACQVVT